MSPTLLLAQLAPPGASNPLAQTPRLPDAPLMERWLFEEPLTLIVILVVLTLAGAYFLLRAGRARAALITLLVGAVLSAAPALSARLVTTQRERLVERTALVFRAVVGARASDLAPVLADNLAVDLLGRRSARDKRGVLLRVAQDLAAQYDAKDSQLAWAKALIDGPNSARSQLKVMVRSRYLGSDMPTVWMLHWRRVAGAAPDDLQAWQITRIEAQQLGLMSGAPDF